ELRLDGREERQHGDAEFQALFGDGQQGVDGKTYHAGHGGYRLAHALAFGDEHRVDEIIDRQSVLAHEAAGEIVAAIAPGPSGRKVGLWQKCGHCSSRKPGQGTTLGEIQFSICFVASSSPMRWVAENATACSVPRSDNSFLSAAMARTLCP